MTWRANGSVHGVGGTKVACNDRRFCSTQIGLAQIQTHCDSLARDDG